MDKYSNQDAYINYIKNHYLPARLTFILYLVQKNHSYYGHFPMNHLRSLGISNVMTTHYIVLDMDLHLSGNVQPLFDKLVNAYEEMTHLPQALSDKSFLIASFALCSFGNFGSIAIQLGGIGELAPNQRKNLARLGVRALIFGTLTCYMSAAIAGVLFN